MLERLGKMMLPDGFAPARRLSGPYRKVPSSFRVSQKEALFTKSREGILWASHNETIEGRYASLRDIREELEQGEGEGEGEERDALLITPRSGIPEAVERLLKAAGAEANEDPRADNDFYADFSRFCDFVGFASSLSVSSEGMTESVGGFVFGYGFSCVSPATLKNQEAAQQEVLGPLFDRRGRMIVLNASHLSSNFNAAFKLAHEVGHMKLEDLCVSQDISIAAIPNQQQELFAEVYAYNFGVWLILAQDHTTPPLSFGTSDYFLDVLFRFKDFEKRLKFAARSGRSYFQVSPSTPNGEFFAPFPIYIKLR